MEFDIKKQQIIEDSLNVFTKHGLHNTTTRILCQEMKINSGGMYYYFKNMEELTIKCAKEAAVIISNEFIFPTLEGIFNQTIQYDEIVTNAKKMNKTMAFLIQVYTEPSYKKDVQEYFGKLSQDYIDNTVRNSNYSLVKCKDIVPYIQLYITLLTNFMIFEDTNFLKPQMDALQKIVFED